MNEERIMTYDEAADRLHYAAHGLITVSINMKKCHNTLKYLKEIMKYTEDKEKLERAVNILEKVSEMWEDMPDLIEMEDEWRFGK